MRILYLTSRFPFGGAEAFLSAEVKALQKLGVAVEVVPCVRHSGEAIQGRWDPTWGHVHAIDPFPAWLRAIRSPSALRAMSTAVGPIARERSKLALRGLLRSSIAAEIAKIFPQGIDHIHAHWADTPATVAMATSRLLGVPWSFTAHRGDIVFNNDLAAKMNSARFTRFISKSGIDLATDVAGPPPESVLQKMRVIPLGVDVPDTPRPHAPPGNEVLSVGQLKEVKGHRYLIQAAALLRERNVDFTLHIVGEGALEAELRDLIQTLGLTSCVHLAGALSHPELFARFRSGSVNCVVLPSVDLGDGEHEGIPVSLIEAMAHAIPVVSTTTGGIPELVSSDAVGLLVEHKNPTLLADRMELLLGQPEVNLRIGAQARAEIIRNWSARESASQLVQAMQLVPAVGGSADRFAEGS